MSETPAKPRRFDDRAAVFGEGAIRDDRKKKVYSRTAALNLSDEERAEINRTRTPGNQLTVSVDDFCNGKTTGRAQHPFCRKPAGWGTKHPGVGFCKDHGGATQSGNVNAARTLGRRIIRERKQYMTPEHPDFQKFGGDRYITNATAEEALLEEVRRSVAMVRFLEDRIGKWQFPNHELPALVDETAKGASTITDEAAWLTLYREERAHMVRTSKMAIDAGIAERMVKIAEDQGRLLAGAIKSVLAALNLTPDQAKMVPQVVPGVLRALSAGASVPSPDALRHTPEPLPALLQREVWTGGPIE